MSSLITQTLNAQRPAAQKFTLMILPDDGWPTFEDFEDVVLLVARIKTLIGTQCCLFAFLGHRLPITAGPHRFLQTPLGPLPLFEIPQADTLEAAQFGWVGSDMDTPRAPSSDTEEVTEDEAPTESQPVSNDPAIEPQETVNVPPQPPSGLPGPPVLMTNTPMF